jgi:hypothetical protein
MSDEELLEFVADFRDGILNGRSPDHMCYMVSWPLHSALNALGFQCYLVSGAWDETMDHFWIELPDGRILDPTASQFPRLPDGGEMPEVYLGALPEGYSVPASAEW